MPEKDVSSKQKVHRPENYQKVTPRSTRSTSSVRYTIVVYLWGMSSLSLDPGVCRTGKRVQKHKESGEDVGCKRSRPESSL